MYKKKIKNPWLLPWIMAYVCIVDLTGKEYDALCCKKIGWAGRGKRTCLTLVRQIGLLKPSVRTEARYRLYGEKELLRLQQILFYKELDFPIKEIACILDDPDFDVIQALEGHKKALKARKNRIANLLVTIDKTIIT